jgi:HMG box factor, other
MGPPPRPHRPAQSPHDGNFTLPPIQTQPLSQQNRQSVEAMVLTIPFLNKIKVLSKITPALGKPSPTSPAFVVRGTIIAIEGQDSELVKTMVTYLDSILAKTEDPIANVRIFPGPEVDGTEKNKTPSSESSSSASNMADATVQYLDVIRTWHNISNSAAQYITTPTTPPASTDTSTTTESDSTASISPRTIIPRTENLSITSPTTASASKPPLPVALIPRYQLTTSDHHAIRIPINDAYSPFDHWQWVATLWRGCVGPDMTICIRECEREEYERAGGVEVRLLDANVLVVRVLKEKEGNLGFEDRVLRRLGFEVEEWVRGRKESRVSVDGGR